MSDDGFEEVNVLRKDKPDVVFEGKLIADVSSKDASEASARKSSDRWTELALYELRNGNWAAISVACSDKPGENDFGDVVVIERGPEKIVINFVAGDGQVAETHEIPLSPDLTGERAARVAAMRFWNWTWLAKKLADDAGWDVRERLA